MDTPIEDSNLAHIGSEEDAAARKAAAETEVNWSIAGKEEGVQVWRVENLRDDRDNPKFGINPWPKKRYGEFYSGDSYIILLTKKDEESESFVYDIFFWIGTSSSQDEYGVAAYKANELDDLLDDAPVQHREVQGLESDIFMKCFENNIKYLDGGIESGFRDVDDTSDEISMPTRMFQVRKTKRATVHCVQVAPICDSLNNGDAFILHTGKTVFTWFGETSSAHEKFKATQVAQNMASSSRGRINVENAEDDSEEFWAAIGGKGEIREEFEDPLEGEKFNETKMYVLSDDNSILKVEERQALKSNLVSNDVCLLDNGKIVYVWIGSGSTAREQTQAMLLVEKHLSVLGRAGNTNVVRVKEGQESRVSGFASAFQ